MFLSIPLAVLACVSLAFHFWTNTLGIQVVDLITSSSVDLAALFATVDDTMRSSKIASALEFTVVAGVSTLPSYSEAGIQLTGSTSLPCILQTYLALLSELLLYLREDLIAGKR